MSSGITFKEIQLRNFLSFGDILTTIDLSQPGTILIKGQNVDLSGANGVGKTAIINAICYALFNKPLDNISLNRLINSTNSAKNTLMEVRLIFQHGEDEYEIYRCRGETFNINIIKNSVDVTLDSVSGNDKFIEETIGLSYELFTKIIIFSGNSIPFLLMPVAQQRQQIEELFNITLLAQKAAILKDLIRATERDADIKQAIIREKESHVALRDKQIKIAEARVEKWEQDRIAQVQTLTENLEKLKSIDMIKEKELHELVAEAEKLLAPLNANLTLSNKEHTTLLNNINKISAELEHLLDDRCPYCLQKYEDASKKIEEKNKLLEDSNNNLTVNSERLLRLNEEISDLKIAISDAKKQMKFSSLTEAIRLEATASTAREKMDDLINSSNPHSEALKNLKMESMEQISYDELDKIKQDIDHQQFLLKLLTDKNSFIRRKIINRTIPFLNRQLMTYTKELGLPHVVKFDDDMSCAVSEYGRELDFGNLSSGEKKRVNLSLSLAFRDVLHHLHAKVNCLFIDEIDASLDSNGVDDAFRLLKKKARDEDIGVWIISHRPEASGRFDRMLVIRKENGFSSIVDDVETDEI